MSSQTWEVRQTHIKEIPFTPNSPPLKIQVGEIIELVTQVPVFRYTCSLQTVRSFYRVTLQYLKQEDYTPFVFDIFANDANLDKMVIEAENEMAKKQFLLASHVRTREMRDALKLIYEKLIIEKN